MHSSENLAIALVNVAVNVPDSADYLSLLELILAALLDQSSLQLDQALRHPNIIPVLDFVTVQKHLEKCVICVIALLQLGISAMFD